VEKREIDSDSGGGRGEDLRREGGVDVGDQILPGGIKLSGRRRGKKQGGNCDKKKVWQKNGSGKKERKKHLRTLEGLLMVICGGEERVKEVETSASRLY